VRTARKIRRFIERELLDDPYDGKDPLADELLDSLAIEQLIEHLERSYNITFNEAELVYENFVSLTVLAKFVDDKRRANATH
jgi:acyl carrier protein